ncbi:MAG: hypothetical protein LBV67_05235 [Streptococcaceae bacterium]|nr:hypothetical protein [Streptococcaceae bacterium]
MLNKKLLIAISSILLVGIAIILALNLNSSDKADSSFELTLKSPHSKGQGDGKKDGLYEGGDPHLVDPKRLLPVTNTFPDLTTEGVVNYDICFENEEWSENFRDGASAGNLEAMRDIEGLRVKLGHLPNNRDGAINYLVMKRDLEWTHPFTDGDLAGETDGGEFIAAISIYLSGNIASDYDVFYRTYVTDFGWLGWAKNGEYSGSEATEFRLVGIEILVVKKGSQEFTNIIEPYILSGN